MSWIRKKILIPKGYSPQTRKVIAQEIIDYIVDRSKKGRGKDGEKFPGYTSEYAKAKGQTNVDLTLSGEMLNEIIVLSTKNGELNIGFERGSNVNGKAEGNITGSYGKSRPDPLKARDFLDLSQEEINKIINKYPQERSGQPSTQESVRLEAQEIAERLTLNFNLFGDSDDV